MSDVRCVCDGEWQGSVTPVCDEFVPECCCGMCESPSCVNCEHDERCHVPGAEISTEVASLRSQLTVARQALEAIENYDTDFSAGVDENCGVMRSIAQEALVGIRKSK